jgi:hypothetical protein
MIQLWRIDDAVESWICPDHEPTVTPHLARFSASCGIPLHFPCDFGAYIVIEANHQDERNPPHQASIR